MKTVIFYFLVSVLHLKVWAGPHITGNGGDVIVCNNKSGQNKIELLDFYEGRVERGIPVTLDPKQDVPTLVSEMINRLEYHSEYSEVDDKALRQAVHDIYSSFFESSLFLSGVQLVDIPDSNHIAVPKGCKIEQAAIQTPTRFPEDKRFKISQDLWEQMDSVNQAGLIFHELLYMIALESRKEGTNMNSVQIRYINSLIAADRIKTLSPREYFQYVTRYLFCVPCR